MKFIRILPFLLLLTDACVDPVDLPVISRDPVLVVDGLLTDAPGPHQVKLVLAFAADDTLRFPTYVHDAVVKIEDDLGHEEILEEADGIVYNTRAGYRGVVGRKYRLSVVTSDGEAYESAWSELFPAGTVDQISFEFMDNVINKDSPTLPQDQFKVSIDTQGAPGYPNLFRWRWRGVYEIRTYPENHKILVPDPASPTGYSLIPAPLPCSNEGGVCVCCSCWVTEYGQDARVSRNESVNAVTFNDVFVSNITVNPWRFYTKYHVTVDQLSVTEEVYDFWKLAEAQQSGAGNLFQPNVVRIRGNMVSVTRPESEVFGIFGVSAVASRSIFITRDDIPGIPPHTEFPTTDCRVARENSSNEKPSFW